MNKFVALLVLLAAPLSAVHAAGNVAGNVAAGKKVFMRCAECHQVGPSARAGYAPQLNGIIGRPAASTKDFRYSAAMQKSGLVWTEKNLTAFIKSPGDVVPDNKMNFWGIGNAQQIADLLAYLGTFK